MPEHLLSHPENVRYRPSPVFTHRYGLADGRVIRCERSSSRSREHPALVGLLDDPVMKEIAVMMMEGYTIDEIADAKSVSRSTVKRKKELIRQLWEEKMPD